jgi:hypothetical protein
VLSAHNPLAMLRFSLSGARRRVPLAAAIAAIATYSTAIAATATYGTAAASTPATEPCCTVATLSELPLRLRAGRERRGIRGAHGRF